jgi:hypothetical protein
MVGHDPSSTLNRQKCTQKRYSSNIREFRRKKTEEAIEKSQFVKQQVQFAGGNHEGDIVAIDAVLSV